METILTSRDNEGVVELILNRPEKKNAINNQMWMELRKTLVALESDVTAKVLVITGAGGAFCSGADLSGGELVGGDGMARMREINDVALMLHRFSKPTIAKVTGIAAGAGCNMALGCDLIVASPQARFSEIFVKRGLSIDFGGSFLLPRLIGLHKAKELAFFGDILSAQEAFSMGLLNHLIDEDEIDSFVRDWALRLAQGPPIALSLIKSLLNDSFDSTMVGALDSEAKSQAINFKSLDTKEAITAFVEKRSPKFQGR